MSEDKALMKHIESLGLGSIKEYTAWCKAQGIGAGLNKTESQRKKESALLKEKKLQEAIKANKNKFKPMSEQIEEVVKSGKTGSYADQSPIFYNLANKFGWNKMKEMSVKEKEDFLLFIAYLSKKSKLAEENRIMESLFEIFRYRHHWIRPYSDWKPQSKNVDRQFSALIRHLFTKYKLPLFLDSVWADRNYHSNEEGINWFLHVASGKNIRKADKLPIPLTKTMAHLFLEAPSNYNILQAFRYGQILGMGGDRHLVNTLVQTFLGRRFEQEPFWETVIQFFIQNPFLDRNQLGPILDYLQNQKFGLNAPQPNLSMKGRNPQLLLDAVQAWHKDLQKARGNGHKQWQPSGFSEFLKEEISGGSIGVWTVTEMTNSTELNKDSRALHHCVSSYAFSCMQGRCTIFSIKHNNERVATIEVIPQSKTIVQARQKFNAPLEARTRQIMTEWASNAGLSISC